MNMSNPSYFEIQADNTKRAVSFYGEIFDWRFEAVKGLPVEYWRETSGAMVAVLKRPAKIPPSEYGTNAFVCSMEVANFDTVAEKIINQGSQIALPKFAVPGKCWQGYFLDTEGNTFGIFQVDERAK